MSQIFDSLKALISPDMISKASAFLGEKDSKVTSAISSVVPGLLGALAQKGETQQVKSVLEDGCRSHILSNLGNIFSGRATDEQQSVGNRFMDAILGNKATDFTSAVASQNGISNMSAGKLTSMLSMLTAGFLGNKMMNNSAGLSGIMADLNREKNSWMNLVPNKAKAVPASTMGISNNNANKDKKKGGWGWLTWLIIILAIVLLFFWWRSCDRNDVPNTDREIDRMERRDSIENRNVHNVANTNMNDNDRSRYEIELGNGTVINGYRNGTEDKVVKYLKSDDWKNYKNTDNKMRWFGYDDIRFKFDSATELQDGSEPQLDNIASILKYYSDTKVVIGGFADVVGSDRANDQISKERADYIKTLLVQKGVNANRISTEGYGEDFAKHDADDSDRQRAEDRTIAMRFVK